MRSAPTRHRGLVESRRLLDTVVGLTGLRCKPNVRLMPSAKPRPEFKRYGCPHEFDSQIEYMLWAFARRAPMESGAPSRPALFKAIADHLMPGHFEWHDWTWKIVEAMCDVPDNNTQKGIKLVAFPGCSNSAKTRNAVSFACLWWLAMPRESSVTLVSTTVKSLRKRGWAEVQRCSDKLRDFYEGNFVDSRMLWQSVLGDDKNAVTGRAVEEGSIHKVADDIKGVHTRRQMLLIDEATSVPEAIYEACSNLYSYPEEFILGVLGNPRIKLDAFGRFAEPRAGWLSVNVDTDSWDAKGFEYCGGEEPEVIRFDAEKSPNIVSDKLVSRHLPTKDQVHKARVNSGGQTPLYWQNFRGFWAPEGLAKVVFTESAMVTFKGYEKHKFTGSAFRIIGAFDPAYTSGGDRAALRFAKLGEIEGFPGYWGLELMPAIIVPIDAHSSNPAHYQLAEQVRRQCEKVMVGPYEMSCPAENLCIDDTGSGGLGDVIQRTWSPKVHRIEFGGSPSEEPCSIEDVRPANERFKNKRAEMWFRARGILDSGQLRGVDAETAAELTTMQFDDSKAKVVLMSKVDYRAAFSKSPDLADTVAMLAEMARIKGFRLCPLKETAKAEEGAGEVFKNQQALYEGVAYVDEAEEEPKQGALQGVEAVW